MKRIKLTLDVSEHFVRMLQATCQMEGLLGLEKKDQLTALQTLGVVVLGEARGALPDQIHAITPVEWRGDIESVDSLREVREVK